MRTGYPDDFAKNLEWLRALPHKIKLYVPGNHDFHLQVYPGPALQELREAGVWVIGLPGNKNYATYKLPNGMSVLGLPFVKNLPRWAFNSNEEAIWNYIKAMGPHDIVLSHAPAYGVLDRVPERVGDGYRTKHTGIESYAAYAKVYKPKHWFHGHIHEDYGTMQFRDTLFHNVAMCDRSYQHANAPAVLDL
jgi:Icc-related predicted phosphoesterase